MKKLIGCAIITMLCCGCGCTNTTQNYAGSPIYIQPSFEIEPLPQLNFSLFPDGMTDDMFSDREKQLIDNTCILASYAERQHYILTRLKERGDLNNVAVIEYSNNINFRQQRRSMNSYGEKIRGLRVVINNNEPKTYIPNKRSYSTTQQLPRNYIYVKESELK